MPPEGGYRVVGGAGEALPERRIRRRTARPPKKRREHRAHLSWKAVPLPGSAGKMADRVGHDEASRDEPGNDGERARE